MRTLIALSALAAATFMTAPRAEAASYCYDGEVGVTCGFVSLQQCLDASSGVASGTCYVDPMAPSRELIRNQPRKPSAS